MLKIRSINHRGKKHRDLVREAVGIQVGSLGGRMLEIPRCPGRNSPGVSPSFSLLALPSVTSPGHLTGG